MKLAVLLAIWRRLTRVDAVKDARKISKELATRPFSDKYDESAGGGGYLGAGAAQMQYRRGLCDLAKEIEKRPPAPRHPRSTDKR